jgi:Bacterial protein of unknown function (DUF885)
VLRLELPTRGRALVLGLVGLFLAGRPAVAEEGASAPPAWVARSNENAQVLLQALSRFNPEMAGQFGVEGLDEQVMDLGPRVYERSRKALLDSRAELEKRLEKEKDPEVRQDLEILIDSANQFLEEAEAQHDHLVPYFDVPQTLFLGLRALLDDQVAPERRQAALVRLRLYAGLEPGTKPITELARDRTRERLRDKQLLGPVQAEIEQSLGNAPRYIGGIEQLFQKYGISGYEEAYAKLQQDVTGYEQFVRAEILPRARTDFRLPPELYAVALRGSGIDMPVDELVSRAEASFTEIRNEMRTLAPLVAKEKGFTVTDYRDVIRELKKDQIVGDAILPLYEQRIADIEKIIRREHIVTLPERKMRIRLASEAESASIPAPNMHPPRLIGNTGEMGEFVLPLRVPSPDGKQNMGFDDFTYDAAAWTLTAHEGRPGHELQFAANVEHGVSLARFLFALNSVNVEGWALYAEAEMKPYEPLDGQLVALQHRLMRSARAFLDPGLQMGTITREEALRILREDVVLSEAMANQEVERYTFRAPGQAPSYFCGYMHLMELRTEVERMLGADFDRQRYHDFLLAQGTLPPRLLRKAVLEDFVPSQRSLATRERSSGN